MKRFHTPTHLDIYAIEFQIGALSGYYGRPDISQILRSSSIVWGQGRGPVEAILDGHHHGIMKRKGDELAGKVVPL